MANTKEVIVSGGSLPFSKVIKAGSNVYISGMVGRDDKTQEIPFSAADQTKNTMEKLKDLLKQAGTCLDNTLKVTIFVTDMRYFAEVNNVYKTYFSDGKMPARSCVAVSSLPDADAKVEIELIAEVG